MLDERPSDESVLDFMKAAVDHLAQEARDKWISGKYPGFTHEERLRNAYKFDYMKDRAKELIKEISAKVGV